MAETTAAGWAEPLEPAGLQVARVAPWRAWAWRAAMLAAAVVAARLVYGVLLANSAAIADVAARGPRWGYVAAAVALFLANQMITLLRWRWLARAAGVPVTFSDALTLAAAAEAGNLVMPGANGGDAVKLGMIARRRLPLGRLAVVTVTDRVVGLVGLLSVGCAAGAWQWSGGSPAVRAIAATVALLLAAAAGVAWCLLHPRAVELVRRAAAMGPRRQAVCRPVADVAELYGTRRGSLLGAVALSALSQTCSLLAMFSSGHALVRDGAASAVATLLTGPLVLIATALPLPFGALGVTERIGQDLFAAEGFAGGGLATLGYRFSQTLAIVALVAGVGLFRLAQGWRDRNVRADALTRDGIQ
jgi:uncharacterized membrane protein YbhN (UPF0104 family)